MTYDPRSRDLLDNFYTQRFGKSVRVIADDTARGLIDPTVDPLVITQHDDALNVYDFEEAAWKKTTGSLKKVDTESKLADLPAPENGDAAVIMDTNELAIYNKPTGQWVLLKGGGGGGDSTLRTGSWKLVDKFFYDGEALDHTIEGLAPGRYMLHFALTATGGNDIYLRCNDISSNVYSWGHQYAGSGGSVSTGQSYGRLTGRGDSPYTTGIMHINANDTYVCGDYSTSDADRGYGVHGSWTCNVGAPLESLKLWRAETDGTGSFTLYQWVEEASELADIVKVDTAADLALITTPEDGDPVVVKDTGDIAIYDADGGGWVMGAMRKKALTAANWKLERVFSFDNAAFSEVIEGVTPGKYMLDFEYTGSIGGHDTLLRLNGDDSNVFQLGVLYDSNGAAAAQHNSYTGSVPTTWMGSAAGTMCAGTLQMTVMETGISAAFFVSAGGVARAMHGTISCDAGVPITSMEIYRTLTNGTGAFKLYRWIETASELADIIKVGTESDLALIVDPEDGTPVVIKDQHVIAVYDSATTSWIKGEGGSGGGIQKVEHFAGLAGLDAEEGDMAVVLDQNSNLYVLRPSGWKLYGPDMTFADSTKVTQEEVILDLELDNEPIPETVLDIPANFLEIKVDSALYRNSDTSNADERLAVLINGIQSGYHTAFGYDGNSTNRAYGSLSAAYWTTLMTVSKSSIRKMGSKGIGAISESNRLDEAGTSTWTGQPAWFLPLTSPAKTMTLIGGVAKFTGRIRVVLVQEKTEAPPSVLEPETKTIGAWVPVFVKEYEDEPLLPIEIELDTPEKQNAKYRFEYDSAGGTGGSVQPRIRLNNDVAAHYMECRHYGGYGHSSNRRWLGSIILGYGGSTWRYSQGYLEFDMSTQNGIGAYSYDNASTSGDYIMNYSMTWPYPGPITSVQIFDSDGGTNGLIGKIKVLRWEEVKVPEAQPQATPGGGSWVLVKRISADNEVIDETFDVPEAPMYKVVGNCSPGTSNASLQLNGYTGDYPEYYEWGGSSTYLATATGGNIRVGSPINRSTLDVVTIYVNPEMRATYERTYSSADSSAVHRGGYSLGNAGEGVQTARIHTEGQALIGEISFYAWRDHVDIKQHITVEAREVVVHDPAELGNWVCVGEMSWSGAADSKDIQNITPGRYKLNFESSGSKQNLAQVGIRLNNDSSNAYYANGTYSGSSTVYKSVQSLAGVVMSSFTGSTNLATAGEIVITEDYTVIHNKSVRTEASGNTLEAGYWWGGRASSIQMVATGTIQGTMKLYKWVELKPIEMHAYETVFEKHYNNELPEEHDIEWDGDLHPDLHVESVLYCATGESRPLLQINDLNAVGPYACRWTLNDTGVWSRSLAGIHAGYCNKGQGHFYSRVHLGSQGRNSNGWLAGRNRLDYVTSGSVDVRHDGQDWVDGDPGKVTKLRLVNHNPAALITGYIRVIRPVKTHLVTSKPGLITGLWQRCLEGHDITVQPGEVEIAGTICRQEKPAIIALDTHLDSGLALEDDTIYYLYAVKSGTGVTYKFSTLEPKFDRYGNEFSDVKDRDFSVAWHPDGHTTWRYIGQVLSTGVAGNVLAFDHCSIRKWVGCILNVGRNSGGGGVFPHALGADGAYCKGSFQGWYNGVPVVTFVRSIAGYYGFTVIEINDRLANTSLGSKAMVYDGAAWRDPAQAQLILER